jgi:hypothetical protein
MSFEDVWALPEGPLDVAALDEAIADLASSLQIEVRKMRRTHAVDVELRVGTGRILDVLRQVDSRSFVFGLEGERFAEEIEPPRDAAASYYQLIITFLEADDESPPTMVVYSNDADNRRVWAVAHALFRKLAQRMRAEPIEHSPEEAMGWSSAAILTPRN